jgi:hypothetical protein
MSTALFPAYGQLFQDGPKLVGTGATGNAAQGFSVAVSADGNTALVGGQNDNGGVGAAWVFVRTSAGWAQQSTKLVATTGEVGSGNFGHSVALSSDGNTALIGGPSDNSDGGAAWVFSRSGSTWTQQGAKLTGTGNTNSLVFRGSSVALSADGNTALIGALADNGFIGASWVFVRSGTTWSQQGNKLVGTLATQPGHRGGIVVERQHGLRRRAGRQCKYWGGVAIHAFGHNLEPSGPKVDRHGRRGSCKAGHLGSLVRGWPYRADWRPVR